MKTVFLIKKDSEFLWDVEAFKKRFGLYTKLQWGSKYSPYVMEFKTFEEATKMLDGFPEYMFMGAPYFEIVKFLKK